MKQRKWSAEEKFAIVLEGVKGKRTVADICRDTRLARPCSTDGGISF